MHHPSSSPNGFQPVPRCANMATDFRIELAESASDPKQLDVPARHKAETSASTCACAALHYLCDPSTCEQAAVIVSVGQKLGQAPDWPVKITVRTLKSQMRNGCRLCGIIYNGLLANRASSPFTESTYTYIMEDDSTNILIHDECGTVSAESHIAKVVLDFKPQRKAKEFPTFLATLLFTRPKLIGPFQANLPLDVRHLLPVVRLLQLRQKRPLITFGIG